MTLTPDLLKNVLRHFKPVMWYVVSDAIPAGKVLCMEARPGHPEVWAFSLEAFAVSGAELSTHCTMRDFRLWEPTPEDIRQMWPIEPVLYRG